MTVATEACYAERSYTGSRRRSPPGFRALDASYVLAGYFDSTGVSIELTQGVHFSTSIDAGSGAVTVTRIAFPSAGISGDALVLPVGAGDARGRFREPRSLRSERARTGLREGSSKGRTARDMLQIARQRKFDGFAQWQNGPSIKEATLAGKISSPPLQLGRPVPTIGD